MDVTHTFTDPYQINRRREARELLKVARAAVRIGEPQLRADYVYQPARRTAADFRQAADEAIAQGRKGRHRYAHLRRADRRPGCRRHLRPRRRMGADVVATIQTPADRCPKCNAAIDPRQIKCARCWARAGRPASKNRKDVN